MASCVVGKERLLGKEEGECCNPLLQLDREVGGSGSDDDDEDGVLETPGREESYKRKVKWNDRIGKKLVEIMVFNTR